MNNLQVIKIYKWIKSWNYNNNEERADYKYVLMRGNVCSPRCKNIRYIKFIGIGCI